MSPLHHCCTNTGLQSLYDRTNSNCFQLHLRLCYWTALRTEKKCKHSCGFSIKQDMNAVEIDATLLTARIHCGSALQMCLPAAVVRQQSTHGIQLVFLQLHFIQESFWMSGAKQRNSIWKAWATQDAERTKIKWHEEEMSSKGLEEVHCEGLSLIEICVTFLCARSRGEKWGEETEGGRQRMGEPARGKEEDAKMECEWSEIPWMSPAFPTRLIKLWLC